MTLSGITSFPFFETVTKSSRHFPAAVFLVGWVNILLIARRGAGMNFYETKAWKKKRERILKRDGYLCQLALKEGRRVPAKTVHHILPLDRYPQYKMCDWNLVSLSHQAHEQMHNRYKNGALTKIGKRWMMETVLLNNIVMNTTILIIGLPGTGKSTEAKRRLGTGLCYDEDAIASAFRLSSAHSDHHQGARDFALDFFKPFLAKVKDYTDRVVVIRTAPSITELELIDPDELVVCETKHDISRRRDLDALRGVDWGDKKRKIEEAKAWAQSNNIKLTVVK